MSHEPRGTNIGGSSPLGPMKSSPMTVGSPGVCLRPDLLLKPFSLFCCVMLLIWSKQVRIDLRELPAVTSTSVIKSLCLSDVCSVIL